tara:strand:+ start:2204 stop:2404 length:201 start_codon:yes stop_codon:yes gene_type:complete
MAYYVKKQGLSGKVVYWTGTNVWSDDISKKKTFNSENEALNETIVDASTTNTRKKGGFTGSEVVSE